MEMCQLNLTEYVAKKAPLSGAIGIQFFENMLSAINFLGENHILHRYVFGWTLIYFNAEYSPHFDIFRAVITISSKFSDIKPDNVLVQSTPDEEDVVFKLTDFGHGKLDNMGSTVQFGTRLYLAPEIFGI